MPTEHIQGRRPLTFSEWVSSLTSEEFKRRTRRVIRFILERILALCNLMKPTGLILMALFLVGFYDSAQVGAALIPLNSGLRFLLLMYPLGFVGGMGAESFLGMIDED